MKEKIILDCGKDKYYKNNEKSNSTVTNSKRVKTMFNMRSILNINSI